MCIYTYYHCPSQSICVCWNKAIRSLQEQYGVLVEDNASIILQCFTNTLHHKLLDTATQVGQLFPPCYYDYHLKIITVTIIKS